MSKRVLVIEPSPTLRAIILMELQRQKHQVVLFEEYTAAVQALPRFHREPPDVAFVTLQVARPESVQVLMKLRAMYAHTALIMMTTQEESQLLVVRRIRDTVQAILLLKPFRINDVLMLVATSAQVGGVAPGVHTREMDEEA